ncbi:aspartyl/asparaginyl beta-hydroxylase domain-containing protein (plasmid) [Nonomuraea sp. CA-143628]|uniref:aspartyl/asparaginyl beta-hydroxylase domain-containing protein n=1 Tax=Nonomuraea sp. CA-143628 TaxID=3239997 RepID=UPI003D941FC8
MSTATSALADQVACADTLDAALLERVRHEVLTIPGDWVRGYSRFQSGGWGTLSLLNDTGNARDVTIGDTEPVATDLLARMPTTQALLDELGLQYMWARLALLEAGSYLWEHRDYQEAELAETERHRVHIPIVTAGSAVLILAGNAVHLAAGRIWRLTPTFVHGACNAFGPARIHLILDCYADPALQALRGGEHLPEACVRELPAAEEELLADYALTARRLARLGYVEAAEEHLLRLFFQHRLPEGAVYDMVIALHRERGDAAAVESWREHKTIVLGPHSLADEPQPEVIR